MQLVDFLENAARLDTEFIIHDDGYRGRTYSYKEVAQIAAYLRVRFRDHGLAKGDAVLIWSESRPGWVAALWACLLDGLVVVPLDPQSSLALFERIHQSSRTKIVLTGERVPEVAGAWSLSEVERAPRTPELPPVALESADVAEIVYTSGTTAEPKGVIITHGNLLANLEPIAREIAKYQRYAKPFLPLRILNLLPLSHLFGQSLALFIPPLIPVSVVFMTGTSAQEIVRQIHLRRVSAIVAVPKILEILRDVVLQRFPEAAAPDPGGHWLKKWWRYRRVHRMLGWKFWCFISGGAPLAPELEQFWSRLGYVVVQGYGLTETAPIVTLSHPFHVRRGTVGRPLGGVKVKVAEDGEVLVQGGNVSTGYFESPGETKAAFEDGWFHTGDIGELDPEGHLRIRGRKKEMIVTPDGRKVFPEDIEKVLDQLPGVRESAVIGKDRVHAVLVLDPGETVEERVREANQRLEDHQKIQAVSVWTGPSLPRTPTTGKLRRAEIADAIARGKTESAAKPQSGLIALMQKYAPGRTITPETTLDELGLSSLDRVQLMMELEQKLGRSIDEDAFTSVQLVADLELTKPAAPSEPIVFPTYNRWWLARSVRRVALPCFLLPLTRIFAHIHVSGIENLNEIRGPAMFASSHQSHLDVPVILASLPSRWRYRLATAMSKDFFDPHFFPERHSFGEWFLNTVYYRLSTFLFNAFPLPQHGPGAAQAIRYMGELVEQRWSILIFPEGDRSRTGSLLPFRPGIGMIGSRLGIPVVPVRILGLERVLHRDWKFPKPGRVEVRFGKPLQLTSEEFAESAQRVQEAVEALSS